jgi:transposase
MGKQLQVDWGETKQKTVNNKEIKLYFIAFVLANSRHKYMEWQARPFTTREVHQTTKKRPAEVFLLEKQHLQPVS